MQDAGSLGFWGPRPLRLVLWRPIPVRGLSPATTEWGAQRGASPPSDPPAREAWRVIWPHRQDDPSLFSPEANPVPVARPTESPFAESGLIAAPTARGDGGQP